MMDEAKPRREIFERMMKKGVPGGVTKEFTDWLMITGYFNAPASLNHHHAYEGGLFDHSLEVTNYLVTLTQRGMIQWLNPRSPYIIGMFHDICKVDEYIRNPEADPRWEKSDRSPLPGHGEKSVMILSNQMTLTEEEILCIRFHMGAYETEAWRHFDRAIQMYATVMWTHTADMLSAKAPIKLWRD